MDSYFAPAERTDRRLFANQVEDISNSPIMNALLEATGGLLAVLNEDRQIVGLNDAFLDSLGISDPASVLGLRLGEALHCVHAPEAPHGCGTTPHCVTCGAAIAMMSAICDDQTVEQTCSLTAEKNGTQFERFLTIKAQPLKVDAHRWILIFAQDITQQHFLTSLEQVFFHDVSNLLTAIVGNSQLLAKRMPDQKNAQNLEKAVKRLSAEFSLQRFLSSRKDDTALLKMGRIPLSDIRSELQLILDGHPKARHRNLEQTWPQEDLCITTDIHLISRVLANMLLNALEATPEGGTARLVTHQTETAIIWEVWNDAYTLPEIQLRVFQKYFSTKAAMGRGIGTHAMKLLGESYLNGKVSFTSSLEAGTTFRFEHPLQQ